MYRSWSEKVWEARLNKMNATAIMYLIERVNEETRIPEGKIDCPAQTPRISLQDENSCPIEAE